MISSLFAKTGTDAPTAEPSLDAQSGVASGGQSSSPDESASDDRGPSEQELPLDVTFEILKNRRRRLVLDYLREADETVRIGELAEHIAAIENDIPVQQLNSQQRKRVYIGLYQCHLPKMDDAGVVDFNQDRGLVDLTDAGDTALRVPRRGRRRRRIRRGRPRLRRSRSGDRGTVRRRAVPRRERDRDARRLRLPRCGSLHCGSGYAVVGVKVSRAARPCRRLLP